MKRAWIGLGLLLSLWVAPMAQAVELSGTWKGDNGQTYILQQKGKQVVISGRQVNLRTQLTEDDTFLKTDTVTLQWVDDDTLVVKTGQVGNLTRLRRQ